MNSLASGVFAVYLFVVLVMVAVGPLVILLERRRRRHPGDKPSTGGGA
jgi:hypothetical protein